MATATIAFGSLPAFGRKNLRLWVFILNLFTRNGTPAFLALDAAAKRGEIGTVLQKVSNTDYVRVLREYCEKGVQLVVGEAFGISKSPKGCR